MIPLKALWSLWLDWSEIRLICLHCEHIPKFILIRNDPWVCINLFLTDTITNLYITLYCSGWTLEMHLNKTYRLVHRKMTMRVFFMIYTCTYLFRCNIVVNWQRFCFGQRQQCNKGVMVPLFGLCHWNCCLKILQIPAPSTPIVPWIWKVSLIWMSSFYHSYHQRPVILLICAAWYTCTCQCVLVAQVL